MLNQTEQKWKKWLECYDFFVVPCETLKAQNSQNVAKIGVYLVISAKMRLKSTNYADIHYLKNCSLLTF